MFQLGGYFLPFAVCGGISAVAGFSAICLLEDYRGAGKMSFYLFSSLLLRVKLTLFRNKGIDNKVNPCDSASVTMISAALFTSTISVYFTIIFGFVEKIFI